MTTPSGDPLSSKKPSVQMAYRSLFKESYAPAVILKKRCVQSRGLFANVPTSLLYSNLVAPAGKLR